MLIFIVMLNSENDSNLELRIRIVEGEIRESKREKDKIQSEYLTSIIATSLFSAIGLTVLFIEKRQEYFWQIISGMIVAVLFFSWAWWYWYNKYQKECQKIKKLERELDLLEKGLIQGSKE